MAGVLSGLEPCGASPVGSPAPGGKLLVQTVRQLGERWEQALQALEADPAKVPGFFREAACA